MSGDWLTGFSMSGGNWFRAAWFPATSLCIVHHLFAEHLHRLQLKSLPELDVLEEFFFLFRDVWFGVHTPRVSLGPAGSFSFSV